MILDFYPTHTFFKINEKPSFTIITNNEMQSINGEVEIFNIDKKIETIVFVGKGDHGKFTFTLNKSFNYGGYVVRISVQGATKLTAFDVLDTWLDFPRYGYVSDFSPNRDDLGEKIETMNKYHINGVQFYDWQYRHDALLPSQQEYLDPFNRPMSMTTVNEWIEACHEKGMVAMPYLAIYAASVEFWQQHKDWGMYDDQGKPLMFEDFLGLVDPTYQSKWFKHIDAECDKVLAGTQFDGLHIDQYGEPKKAFDATGKSIDIPKAFVDFINHQKGKNKGYVLFNAVGDWPTKDLAKSDADFMYIEVWADTPTFDELSKIVLKARKLSGQKPVVIPIYIKKKDFNNVLLADAVIVASGGTHLEIGDGDKLLSDPYFPKAEDIDEEQKRILRRYWDFIVGNQQVLGPVAIVKNVAVVADADVMIVTRKSAKRTVINLVNCKKTDQWTKHMTEPKVLTDMTLTVEINYAVKGVVVASPDEADFLFKPVAFSQDETVLKLKLPKLKVWTTVVIEEE